MVRAARAIRCTAALILLVAASVSFGADQTPAAPSRRPRGKAPARDAGRPAPRGDRKAGEARLETVKIVGSAERPAILFFLPRARFRLLPLRPEEAPGTTLLRDDKLTGEPPGS